MRFEKISRQKLKIIKLIICLCLWNLMEGLTQPYKLNDISVLRKSLRQLNEVIVPKEEWLPYPDINDPGVVPQKIKQVYITEAEKIMSESWTPLPASIFLEYIKTKDRDNYERLMFERRNRLAIFALAEMFENKGRFITQLADGIWAVCEETFWGVPAHLFLQKEDLGLPDVNNPVVDLFASETAAELAWIYYLLKLKLNELNPMITERIQQEVNRRIFIPYLTNDEWTYLGFKWRQNPDSLRRVNNWNPWVNSNVLAAALILSKAEQRNYVIDKTLRSIINFIEPFPADGGSDEGPQYWGRAAGAVCDYLELLKSASDSKIDAFDSPLIKKMGAYIYKVYIRDRYFVNYGDADGVLDIDPALLYRFGKQTRNDTLMSFSAYIAKRSGYGNKILPGEFGVLNRVLPGLFCLKDLKSIKAKEPLLRDVWLPDIEFMAARSASYSEKGLYLAVKGGNNGVSHNHNDVGSFTVYANGRPILIDAGTKNYTSATFSNKRYDIWNNQSSYHNLPTINGMMQKDGPGFKATDIHYSTNNKYVAITMDIAKAYPEKANIVFWRRNLRLNRGKQVILKEDFLLSEYHHPYQENFISPLTPQLERDGVVLLTNNNSGEKYRIYYDSVKFNFHWDEIVVSKNTEQQKVQERMSMAWGDKLYRIRLVSKTDRLKDEVSFIIK